MFYNIVMSKLAREIEAFISLCELKRFLMIASPWAKTRNIHDWLIELRSEIDEVQEAIDKNQSKNELASEISDVFSDALSVALQAEKDGVCTLADVLRNVNAKLRRRKPWIKKSYELYSRSDIDYDKYIPSSIEEENVIWDCVKDMENVGKERSIKKIPIPGPGRCTCGRTDEHEHRLFDSKLEILSIIALTTFIVIIIICTFSYV